MDTTYKTLVAVHGIAGLIALVTYWMAAAARKGSPLHRGVGKAYVMAMLAILVTAVPLAIAFFLNDRPGIGTFLGYLVVLTGTALWLGRRAIHRKRDQASYRDRIYGGVAMLNLASALLVFAIGMWMQEVLLMGFSVIGVLNGVPMLHRMRRPMADANWWLQEHYNAMIACGAATHVAFLSLGLNRMAQSVGIQPPSWYGLLGWFVPVAASLLAAAWMDRRYKPRRRPAAGIAPRAA